MRAFVRCVLAGVCALWLAACSRPELYQQEAFVFGTRVELQIYGLPEPAARAAASAVLQEFDRLHGAYHAWQPSQLTALNAAIARGEHAIAVSSELAAMLAQAKALSLQSDGLFNPAIGGLIALWGFHSDTFAPQRPAAEKIAAQRAAHPSMADIEVLPATRQVQVSNRAVQLDFGGYAKGYALDRAAAILRAQGVRDALINIGGNVIALGTKGRQPWRVGIAQPRGTGALASLELRDGEAIGTSGDYQRYFEIEGTRYCHVLDPRSGYPAAGTQSVTVLIAPGPHAGVWSDAASKPMFIDSARWRERARQLDVAAVLRVSAAGEVHATRAMAERLIDARGVAVVD